MGDIAEMHVAAYSAGLDPNEMDGADWGDFFDDEAEEFDPPDADYISTTFRVMLMGDFMEAANDGETLHQVIRRIFPQITEGQASGLLAFADAIGAMPHED